MSDVVNVAAINPHSCVNPAAAGDAKNPPVDTEGWISIRVSTANQIAAKSIHQSKWRQPHGHQAANAIGGSRSVSSGSAGYEARTAVNGGSELLIFVQPKASSGFRCHSSLAVRAY